MKNFSNRFFYPFVIAAGIVTSIGCGGGGGGGVQQPTASSPVNSLGTTTVAFNFVDKTNAAITPDEIKFSLDGGDLHDYKPDSKVSLPNGATSVYVRAKKTGYFDVYKNISKVSAQLGDVKHTFKMDVSSALPGVSEYKGTITDPTVVNTIGDAALTTKDVYIEFPPNSLGNAAFGTPKDIKVTYYNVSSDAADISLLQAFPGDFEGIQSGKVVPFETFGFIKVDLGDLNSTYAEGSPQPKIKLKADNGGPTMPLWSFNEKNGKWEFVGDATWNSAGYYEFNKIPHFSYYNLDRPITNPKKVTFSAKAPAYNTDEELKKFISANSSLFASNALEEQQNHPSMAYNMLSRLFENPAFEGEGIQQEITHLAKDETSGQTLMNNLKETLKGLKYMPIPGISITFNLRRTTSGDSSPARSATMFTDENGLAVFEDIPSNDSSTTYVASSEDIIFSHPEYNVNLPGYEWTADDSSAEIALSVVKK